jgi:hypothetical protein
MSLAPYKRLLLGQQFVDHVNIIVAVTNWLQIFVEGFSALVSQWEMCLNTDGNHTEK